MHVSLLGPLRVERDDEEVVFAAAKERSLLGALALSHGSVVHAGSLIGALWGEQPPLSARKTLQTYVSNLRRALGSDAIVTSDTGYMLRIEAANVDIGRFRLLVRKADEAFQAGAAEERRRALTEALSLWRGDPFPGVAAHTDLAAAATQLKEEYLSALESRVAADLAVARHDDLVGELEALVREHPFRERLWGYLMVALYRCGRQADSLAAYQRVRALLADELGLEPGGELRRLEAAVLNHDPSLSEPGDEHRPRSDAVLRSPVRYARCPDGTNIAFQTSGDGPIDILAIPGFVSHLDIWWNAPTDRLVRGLTSVGRLICFDKRGMGLSDRPESVEAERWVDDAVAVLDAVGARPAVVLGVSAGATTAVLLASRHPERVRALVLFGGFARTIAGPDYDIGLDHAVVESFARNLESGWGTGVAISSFAPSRARDEGVRGYWARYQQLSASPTSAMRFFWAVIHSDVRDVLTTIAVPTLVVHAERDVIVPIEQARYMADRIPGAEFVPLDSDVHLICLSDAIDQLTREVQAFVARKVFDRQVAPVLVTALAIHATSSRHRMDIEGVLERCGGRLQGPPLTATFDGPGAAIRCARGVVSELAAAGVHVGVGLHCGECVPTDVGYRGVAVDVARQLATEAAAGEILLTRTVRDLVLDGDIDVHRRGVLSRPGWPKDSPVYALVPESGRAEPPVRVADRTVGR